MTARVLVAAIGNEWRCDDGAGPAVARLVRATRGEDERVVVVGSLADELDLLGVWDDADVAVVVDATRSGAPAGTISRVELEKDGPPEAAPSTHGLGLPGVLSIAEAVGQAPRRVVVVGIEGARFEQGGGLSDAVARAVPTAAGIVEEVIAEALGSS